MLTIPSDSDCDWLAVTCSPDETTVEFCETRAEAVDAARVNLMPTVSTYVGHLELQGEHRVRGSAKHIAVHVEVTPAVRAALRARFPGLRDRRSIQRALSDLLRESLERLGGPVDFDTEITAVIARGQHANPEEAKEDGHGGA